MEDLKKILKNIKRVLIDTDDTNKFGEISKLLAQTKVLENDIDAFFSTKVREPVAPK